MPVNILICSIKSLGPQIKVKRGKEKKSKDAE